MPHKNNVRVTAHIYNEFDGKGLVRIIDVLVGYAVRERVKPGDW